MKYAVFIIGGISDRPMPDYSNITPLFVAEKENIDKLAEYSETGLVRTSEFTEKPCVQKALFSLFGYDSRGYNGSTVFSFCDVCGIPDNEDVIFRCSLVNLSSEEVYEEKTMISCSSENMLEYEFNCIFDEISEKLSDDIFKFVKGRNKEIFLIWKKGERYAGDFLPPESVLSERIGEYLPNGDFSRPLYEIMKKSSEVLEDYSSNSLWIWESSVMPEMDGFEKKFGLKGAVVSDTDFARGIGRLAGMKVVSGNSCKDILDEFEKNDIVFYYADICRYGLEGDFDGKAEKISEFDRKILKPVTDAFDRTGEDISIMIVSDITSAAYLERKVSDPVPYMIYRSNAKKKSGFSSFDENTAADSDNYIENPHELMRRFILQHG